MASACINERVGKSVHSREGEEWGDKSGYVLEILKSLHGLKTSARQWSLSLRDAPREMGFSPSRVDADLWMKPSPPHVGYDCM